MDTSAVSFTDDTEEADFSSPTPIRISRKRTYDQDTTPKSTQGCSKQIPTVHVRDSAYKVRDAIYAACAEMDGHGFSYNEMQIALKVVANRVFNQQWEIPVEKGRSKYDETDDIDIPDSDSDCDSDNDNINDQKKDSLPYRSTIHSNLKKIHAYSFSLVGDALISAKHDADSTVTHFTLKYA